MQRPLISAWCTTTPFFVFAVSNGALSDDDRPTRQSIDKIWRAVPKVPPGKEDFQGMKTLPCQANQSAFPKLMTLDMRARAQPSAREAGF